MTRNEYKEVNAIRNICNSIFRKSSYSHAMRSVLNTLSKEFTEKYHNKRVQINTVHKVHYTAISKYKITLGDCIFITKAGFNGTEFGKNILLLSDKD